MAVSGLYFYHMKSPKLIIGIAVIAVVIIGAIAIVATSNKTDQSSPEPTTSAIRETTNPDSKTPATNPPSSGVKTYSMADVAAHGSKTDCYTAISGKVYNLTSWISRHPGGSRAILSICGKDGTSAFTSQHGGQARPEQELASFYIGDLK